MTEPAGENGEAAVHCPVCGHRFSGTEADACHAGCPMAASCSTYRCPSCGTEFPRPGPVTQWLGRLLSGKGKGHG